MYPSSIPSSSQVSLPLTTGNNSGGGLTRYAHSMDQQQQKPTGKGGVGGGGASTSSSSNGFRYMLGDMNNAAGGGRAEAPPAGFLSQLVHNQGSNSDGFPGRRGAENSHQISQLNSQLSFTRQDTISHITQETEELAERINNNNSGQKKSSTSFISSHFRAGSWEDSNTIMFSIGSSNRGKNNEDILSDIDGMESQFQFGTPQITLDMGSMDTFMNIPQDSVTCKIRTKRGCATHPRSIAERERRTRISEKLRKLQDLVPNMDKQTSYSDMLDLAVEHIKTLQNQIQDLNNDIDNCTCGCKKI